MVQTATDPPQARLPRAQRYLSVRLQKLDEQEGLSPGWLAVAFVLAAAAIFSRDPSLFTRPQFWAEDGTVWYAQAYNTGWLHSLTQPNAGYLSTVQRLGAGLALLVPFRWAPLVMNAWGLFIQALPIPILLSLRCRRWCPLSLRIAFAAAYAAIPNAAEIHVVCTNSQWHLIVAQVLLAFAAPPRSLLGRAFDVTIFLIGSVSGPFSFPLVPLLALFWWIRRQPWSLALLLALTAGSIVNLYIMFQARGMRHSQFLGASLSKFVRLLGGDVFLADMLGRYAYGLFEPLRVCILAVLIGVGVIGYCYRYASLELRLFCAFCFIVFGASLASPLVLIPNVPSWNLLLQQPSLRYWFFPSLPFLFAILWCAFYASSRIIKATAMSLTILLLVGIVRDWKISPLLDMQFPEQAARFDAAPPGTAVEIPLNPPPLWRMTLIKKP